MSGAAEIAALIARIEAATGPDRELDAAIALTTGWRLHEFSCININGAGERGELWIPPYFTDEDVAEAVSEYRQSVAANFWPNNDAPAFTASIDAALTLVPADWFLTLTGVNDSWHAMLNETAQGKEGLETGFAPTPALAICIAALKASGMGEG